jgi:tetratricopeptide (TPR) repeat protein
MWYVFCTLITSGLAVFAWNISASSSFAQNVDLICFMITSSGELVDLTHICETEYVDLSTIRLQASERLNNGDFQGAINDYTQLLRYQPNNAEAYFTRGLLYWRVGNTRNAVVDFQASAQLFSQQGEEERYLIAMEQIEQIQSQE